MLVSFKGTTAYTISLLGSRATTISAPFGSGKCQGGDGVLVRPVRDDAELEREGL
jgi:hypothetical protein